MLDPFSTYSHSLRSDACEAPFEALDRLCEDVIGYQLFSCSLFDVDAEGRGTAARIHTSDEDNYPTSGLKEIVPNRWTGIVIDKQETFIANSSKGFEDVFPDHAFITSLGLGSVVNLPVILNGKFLGTVNLLHEAGYYTAERLATLGRIEVAAQLGFLVYIRKSCQAA